MVREKSPVADDESKGKLLFHFFLYFQKNLIRGEPVLAYPQTNRRSFTSFRMTWLVFGCSRVDSDSGFALGPEADGVDETGDGHHGSPPDGGVQMMEHGRVSERMEEFVDPGRGNEDAVDEKQHAAEEPD